MATCDWIYEKKASSGVDVRVWGQRGRESCSEIEDGLEVTLGDELESFVETVGNVSIGPFMLAIAGGVGSEMSAIAETKASRESARLPLSLVKIMDHAGESYFYDTLSFEVVVFDSLNIDRSMPTLSFGSFDEFLNWLFEEARRQLEDPEFAF